eukprot:231770-Chlamydomonas_euryale.AAC.1
MLDHIYLISERQGEASSQLPAVRYAAAAASATDGAAHGHAWADWSPKQTPTGPSGLPHAVQD